MKKKVLGIPVVVISAVVLVCLLAGSAFAAYSFSNVNVNMEVREPMEITMDLGWDALGPIPIEGTVTLDDACTAGDVGYIGLVIKNKSSGDITVATVLGGSYGYFDFTGLPNGVIAAGTTWSGTVTVKVANDAPPGEYPYTITFTRS